MKLKKTLGWIQIILGIILLFWMISEIFSTRLSPPSNAYMTISDGTRAVDAYYPSVDSKFVTIQLAVLILSFVVIFQGVINIKEKVISNKS